MSLRIYKMNFFTSLVITIKCFESVLCVLPPEYFINLEMTESFIIADIFDSDNANDFSNNDLEMIKEPLAESLKPEDEHKFFMLRNIAERKHREAIASSQRKTTLVHAIFTKTPEYLYQMEDEPAYAMLFEEADDLNHNKSKENIHPRSSNKRSDDYSYAQLKSDYDRYAEKEKNSKAVLKYVDVTEKEGLKDSAKNLIKFKPPKNCTKEELKGIGINAARCFFKDVKVINKKTKKEQKNILTRLLKVIFIWLCVYLIIAIPCWCIRGWCCCCCRCKFCKPKQTIDAAKKFLADNPVGVLHVDGQKVTYKPTVYEEYAQRRLEKVVMKL